MQVLSVETALSIQSHPDKELAEKLHAQRPEVQLTTQGSALPQLGSCLQRAPRGHFRHNNLQSAAAELHSLVAGCCFETVMS